MSRQAEAVRKNYNFWGWGWEEDCVSAEERAFLDPMVDQLSGGQASAALAVPKVAEYALRAPRVSPPAALAERFTADPRERLRHAYGQSFEAVARMLLRDVPNPPDHVVHPESEAEIAAVLDWAADANVAVIPFGGGSSVCGGVDTVAPDRFSGVVSLDLARLDQVLEVDKTSRAARIQGGIFGPALEAALRPEGLTLRHFPQSFEFSTLGGWVATRSGGHYATLLTHIDELVESLRVMTPSGLWESRRLPGSGAGPSPDRMMIGSEGIFGVITEAWMRLQDRPRFRGSASVFFDTTKAAGEACRAIAQSGLHPANCRLLDGAEARNNMVGDGSKAIVVLGFESADHPVDAWLERALELAADHGGTYDRDAAARSLSGEAEEHRTGAAGQWRDAFIRMPYLRDYWLRRGMIADTFETSIPWSGFDAFYETVRAETQAAIRSATGREVAVSCRLTHLYPDGCAPYFTYILHGGDVAFNLSAWREIKQATNEIVTRHGGTVTHHHAVGRDHRSGFEAQTPELHRDALKAVKKRLDPAGLLNPGVLIDP